MAALPLTPGEEAHAKELAALRALTIPIRQSAQAAEEARNRWALEQQAQQPDPFFPGGAA